MFLYPEIKLAHYFQTNQCHLPLWQSKEAARWQCNCCRKLISNYSPNRNPTCTGVEQQIFTCMKWHYNNPRAHFILMEKAEWFIFKNWSQWLFHLPALFNITLGILSSVSTQTQTDRHPYTQTHWEWRYREKQLKDRRGRE